MCIEYLTKAIMCKTQTLTKQIGRLLRIDVNIFHGSDIKSENFVPTCAEICIIIFLQNSMIFMTLK